MHPLTIEHTSLRSLLPNMELTTATTSQRVPEIVTDKDQMRKWSRSKRLQGKTIGLVPTMGYLHEGHLSLVQEARNHTDLVVVSIYVNPGQFSPSEDFSTYPSDFDGDLLKLMSVSGGVDAVFCPRNLYDYKSSDGGRGGFGISLEVMSGGGGGGGGTVVSCLEETRMGHETWVRVETLEKVLCGKSRPLLYRGVATVVSKLFNIVEPDVAVFGKKDYQQWRLIRRMVTSLRCGINLSTKLGTKPRIIDIPLPMDWDTIF